MNISGILERFGIQNERLIEVINVLFTMLVVSLIGWLAYVVAKKFLPKLIKKIAGATRQHWSEWLLDQRFFNRLALLIMPIVLRTGLSPIKWEHMATINRILDIWIVVAIALLVSAFMSGINRVYEKMASVRDKPVKIITQVITVVIWCAVALIIISIFTRESLAVLLGGLTAFAAVLMLVFQDTILGFVAGIQLSSNNMVRLGDWIVMPSRGVDGEVTEIGLTTVKVQNWDKTITTVPTHKLVSESFTNWRGMEESGGRRIKRSVNIDVSSIHYLSDAELATLGSSQLLRRYMEKKLGRTGGIQCQPCERPRRKAPDQHRHLPRVHGTVDREQSRHQPGHDAHGTAAPAGSHRPAAGNLLLLRQTALDRLRERAVRPVRPCLCRNALVQPAGIPIFGRSGRTGTVTALKQKGAALWKNSTAPFFIPAAPAQPTVAFRRYRLRASAACSS